MAFDPLAENSIRLRILWQQSMRRLDDFLLLLNGFGARPSLSLPNEDVREFYDDATVIGDTEDTLMPNSFTTASMEVEEGSFVQSKGAGTHEITSYTISLFLVLSKTRINTHHGGRKLQPMSDSHRKTWTATTGERPHLALAVLEKETPFTAGCLVDKHVAIIDWEEFLFLSFAVMSEHIQKANNVVLVPPTWFYRDPPPPIRLCRHVHPYLHDNHSTTITAATINFGLPLSSWKQPLTPPAMLLGGQTRLMSFEHHNWDDTEVDQREIHFIGVRGKKKTSISEARSFIGDDPQDEDGHGTQVAALVAKMAPHVDLYIEKFSDAKEAIGMDQYRTESQRSRRNKDIIQMETLDNTSLDTQY
ncbi:Peptidase-S8 domain-containing protein [Fusarium sp. LHS14.1]|nr:Peptidase-S8 domain-containing protein [Fusarium sp. LHS14.1]